MLYVLIAIALYGLYHYLQKNEVIEPENKDKDIFITEPFTMLESEVCSPKSKSPPKIKKEPKLIIDNPQIDDELNKKQIRPAYQPKIEPFYLENIEDPEKNLFKFNINVLPHPQNSSDNNPRVTHVDQSIGGIENSTLVEPFASAAYPIDPDIAEELKIDGDLAQGRETKLHLKNRNFLSASYHANINEVGNKVNVNKGCDPRSTPAIPQIPQEKGLFSSVPGGDNMQSFYQPYDSFAPI